MKARPSHIVVDADVAHAAGLSEDPISKSSRDLLMGIKDSSMLVAFCPALLEEWKNHRSNFSARWLSSMMARRKVLIVTPPALINEEVEKSEINDAQKKIAKKDAHVVDIAISTGNFVASNDKKARAVFCLIASRSPVLHRLMWAVPTDTANEINILFSSEGYLPRAWHLLGDKAVA